MAKKKLTANDLDKTLRDFGFKEGDEIYLSSDETESNEQSEGDNEGGEGQGTTTTTPPTGGGSQPPPDKERP